MKQVFSLVDERISDDCLAALVEHGFSVIKLPKMATLPPPIASHTDILSFKLGDKIFFSEKYFEEFFEALAPLDAEKVTKTKSSQGANYPLDAIFNGLVMGNKLFCKADTFSKEIISYAVSLGMKIQPVKQGYPACTTLKISENAAITSDRGMARALKNENISVLEIENGGILLPPYEYGFIGGAGAVYGDKVYFFGDIEKHSDADKILEFIRKHGKSVISLSQETLRDLGGILFIEEDI